MAAGGTTPPTPAKTGNAGLLGDASTSLALMLSLAAVAVVGALGARTVIRQR